jgi:hypothetical protein
VKPFHAHEASSRAEAARQTQQHRDFEALMGRIWALVEKDVDAGLLYAVWRAENHRELELIDRVISELLRWGYTVDIQGSRLRIRWPKQVTNGAEAPQEEVL